jgi:hypothetical protein
MATPLLPRLAERLGTWLLRVASDLLRYAERSHGPSVSPKLYPPGKHQLPPRVEVLIEELLDEDRRGDINQRMIDRGPTCGNDLNPSERRPDRPFPP